MSLSIPKKSNMQFSILPKQYASVDGEILYTFDQDQPQTVDFCVIEQPSARLLAGNCANFRQNYLAASPLHPAAAPAPARHPHRPERNHGPENLVGPTGR